MNKFAIIAALMATISASKINPGKPEGLVPPPRTVDLDPLEHQQLRKPLIPENRNSENDLMNVQLSENPYEISFDREQDLLGTGHGAGVDEHIENHEGEMKQDRRFFAHEEPHDYVQVHARI